MLSEQQRQDVVYALAASPSFAADGICFSAQASGLYRSQDGGRIWHPAYATMSLTTPLPTMTVGLSPDFATDQTVFAGVSGGVLRSRDGGRHWETVAQPAPAPAVTALAVSPNFAHDGTALAGTAEDGVLCSSDGGNHWATWNFGLLDLNVLCLAVSPSFAKDATVFIGTESGIFRSANGGRTWREVPFPTVLAPVLSLALSPAFSDDGVLFAGSEAYGLLRSADGGQTWERLGKFAIGEVAVNQIILATKFPKTPAIMVLSSETLLISRDGGQTWSDWKAGLDLAPGATCAAAPRGLAGRAPVLIGRVGGEILRV